MTSLEVVLSLVENTCSCVETGECLCENPNDCTCECGCESCIIEYVLGKEEYDDDNIR